MRMAVTGFGPFPGAPENPTAALMARLEAAPPALPAGVDLVLRVLPTRYDTLAGEIAALGPADLGLHFGLARCARGFRLESRAVNRVAIAREDAAGACPGAAVIAPGAPEERRATLPLATLERALRAAGLPVETSQDCGDYLCNALLYHALAGLIPGYAPRFAGFIHVPLAQAGFTAADLERGARLLIATAVQACRPGAAP